MDESSCAFEDRRCLAVTEKAGGSIWGGHDCPEGAEEFEGTKAKIFPLYHFDTGGHESADGIAYIGSNEEEFGGATNEETWNFLGTP